MDIVAARTFLEIVKTGSFVRAATNLNITQTAVSARVRVLEEQPVDVVIASRYQKGSVIKGVPYYRQVLSLGCFVMMKSILPFRNVRDYSTGFRVYRASVISRASSDPPFEATSASQGTAKAVSCEV